MQDQVKAGFIILLWSLRGFDNVPERGYLRSGLSWHSPGTISSSTSLSGDKQRKNTFKVLLHMTQQLFHLSNTHILFLTGHAWLR